MKTDSDAENKLSRVGEKTSSYKISEQRGYNTHHKEYGQ